MKLTGLFALAVLAAAAAQAGEPNGAGDTAASADAAQAQTTAAQDEGSGDGAAAFDETGGGGRRERPRQEPPGQGRQPRFLGPPQRAGPPRAQGLRQGRILPPEARGRMVRDYQNQRLRQPPPGYAYYQVGDTIYLANQDTGLIFETVPVGPPPRP